MRVRALDSDYDMVFGHSAADFYRDQPEAPAQAVYTRLRLWFGEWFLDTSDGTPWMTQVLGERTALTRDMILRERILNTPSVTGIANFQSYYDGGTRSYTARTTIDTAFGTATV